MKVFKKIDVWVSALLIFVFPLLGLITMNENFFYGYFVVGGWQGVSMLVHTINKWFIEKRSTRLYYHKLVLLVVVVYTLLTGIVIMTEFLLIPLLLLLYVLLFASPVMAIFYTYMCYQETYIKMRRPMELLK